MVKLLINKQLLFPVKDFLEISISTKKAAEQITTAFFVNA